LSASYIARRCGNSALQGSQYVAQKSRSTTSLPRWSLSRNVCPDVSRPVKSGARVPAGVVSPDAEGAAAPPCDPQATRTRRAAKPQSRKEMGVGTSYWHLYETVYP